MSGRAAASPSWSMSRGCPRTFLRLCADAGAGGADRIHHAARGLCRARRPHGVRARASTNCAQVDKKRLEAWPPQTIPGRSAATGRQRDRPGRPALCRATGCISSMGRSISSSAPTAAAERSKRAYEAALAGAFQTSARRAGRGAAGCCDRRSARTPPDLQGTGGAAHGRRPAGPIATASSRRWRRWPGRSPTRSSMIMRAAAPLRRADRQQWRRYRLLSRRRREGRRSAWRRARTCRDRRHDPHHRRRSSRAGSRRRAGAAAARASASPMPSPCWRAMPQRPMRRRP